MMKCAIVMILATIALCLSGNPVRSTIGSSNISRIQKQRPYASFVSYLETTDITQYVMTPMLFRDIPYSRIEIRWTLAPGANSTNRGICGAYQSSAGGYFRLMCGSSVYNWVLGNWQDSNITTSPIGNKFQVNDYTVVVDFPNDYVQVNGVIVDGSPMYRWNNVREAIKNGTSPFVLFRPGLNTNCITGLRIHHCKIWISDELVFDAMPYRVGEEGFMYDAVTGQYFGNLGSGAFVIGSDVAFPTR